MRPSCMTESEGERIAREVGEELERIVLDVVTQGEHGVAVWLSGDWYKVRDIYNGEVIAIFKYEHEALEFIADSYYGTSYEIQRVGVSV